MPLWWAGAPPRGMLTHVMPFLVLVLRPRCFSRGVFVAAAMALTPFPSIAQDVVSGKEVYGPCAACHGANGEGGKGGEYPRLAGQPASYIIEQLLAFRTRRRPNMPMVPYTEPRELPDADMKDVAAYLAAIQLPARVPEFKETDSALDRLLALERVLVVPRVEGNVENGKTVYRRRCAACHGRSGQGHNAFPRLVNQYPNYLRRQVEAYLRAERPHEAEEAGTGVLTRISGQDFTDVLAWLTSIQGQEPEVSTKDGGGSAP